MVVFVCGDCNDVLKKNAVDNHLNRCSCSVISCCDCGKNFSDDTYKAHTQCISEDRKYGPQNEKANNTPDKGQKRQQDWLDRIKTAVSKVNLSGPAEMALNKLLEYPNIPRKKSKFVNFASSCVGIRRPDVVEQIWSIFEAANKSTDEAKPEDSKEESKKKEEVNKDKSKRKTERNADNDDNDEGLNEVLKKKKKKRKHKHESEPSKESSENRELEA